MQRIATHDMDLLLPSLISLLLVAGGGGSWPHASFADAAAPNSDSETPAAYWQAVLPGIPMPPAISDLLPPHNSDEVALLVENMHERRSINEPRKLGPRLGGGQKFQKNYLHANDEKKITDSYKPLSEEDEKRATFSYKPLSEENQKKISYNLYSQEDRKKATFSYKPHQNVDQKKVTFSYKPQVEDLEKKVTFSYNPQNEGTQKKVTYSYKTLDEDDEKKATFSYKPLSEHNQKKITYNLYSQEDQKKVTIAYKPHQNVDQKKVTFPYEPQVEDLEKKVTFSYNPQNEDTQKKVTYSYKTLDEDDEKKATFSYRPLSEQNQKKVMYNLYGQEDQKKVTFAYKPQVKDLEKKVTFSYSPQNKDTQKKLTYSYKSLSEEQPYNEANGKRGASIKGEGHEHAHRADHSHGHSHDQQASSSDSKLADVFFLEDAVRLGSVITPTIPRTTSLPTLLRRDVARSIPFSTDRHADIVAMFAPASLDIADEIRWVLEKCEDVGAADGTEKKAFCATSIEDLVELPMAVLRTRHVQAFSGDMPVEAASSAQRGRYTVAAVRRISDESTSEMVTCHDMTYPYAVYYCHAAGPAARAYVVTLLASSEDGAAPSAMEAVAVCHLDTSRWSPEHPFLRAMHAEPGDVGACHFLPKSCVVWAAGEQGEGQHADQ